MVVVSDAHERSVSTDLLLGLLKKVQRVRRDLRVVIVTTPPTAATFRSKPETCLCRSVLRIYSRWHLDMLLEMQVDAHSTA